MGQKEEDIDIDDLCYYKNPKDIQGIDDDLENVKPCEANFYCRLIINSFSVGTCEKYSQVIIKLDEDCINDECDDNLVCDKKCIVHNNGDTYEQTDLVDTSKKYYYCPSTLISIKQSSSPYKCHTREGLKMDNKCFSKVIKEQ